MNQIVFEEFLVFFGLMASLGCITRVVLAVVRRRREVPEGGSVAAALADLVQRLDRIEQGVEGSAVEIERLAEGQRFTAKLLVESGRGAAAVDARGRVVTPH